jgi:hypothetical protein
MSEVPKTGEGRLLRPRLRGIEDSYGLVLMAIIAALILMGLFSGKPWGDTVVLVAFLLVFFLTLQTSAVSRRTIRLLASVIPLALAIAAAAEIFGSRAYVSGLSPLVSALFVIASIVFIVRRLATHGRVTVRTVFGALCIYLFSALLFALVYHLIALMSGEPFFVQTDNPSGVDYIYFSFITMATVGFGDLSPASDLGRMTAVVEAVGGQLYLVVVVALFVSNLGHQKRVIGKSQTDSDQTNTNN